MAEPFKNELGESRIKVISMHLSKHALEFDENKFLSLALSNLAELSLMERSRQVVAAMKACLPDDFVAAKTIILKSLAPYEQQIDSMGIHSWLAVPVAEYLGRFGGDHFEQAMDGLAAVTPLFSSEWGIRHIIIQHQQKSMQKLREWCDHENEHVRRLVSEGSRPRLPWGFQLKAFITNPELTFPLLERLRDDESDYVRLSVSNHLNDISKDHGDWLQKKLATWVDESDSKRKKLIRHACRTLIKDGHQPTLKMLGYQPIKISEIELNIINSKVKYGESLTFEVSFKGAKKNTVTGMIIDYAIHFKKADGSLSAKVFKWKNTCLGEDGLFSGKKSHAIKPITTRKYYNGHHEVEIMVNGKSVIKKPFVLLGV